MSKRRRSPEAIHEPPAPRSVEHAQIYAELRVLSWLGSPDGFSDRRIMYLVDERLDRLNELNAQQPEPVAPFDQENET